MARKARVTAYDVAREAGVSHNTVSLVMRDSPLVAPETKMRVLQVVQALGYQRHAVAASLRSARSQTLGYLVPYDDADAEIDVYRNQMLKAATTTAETQGYYMLLNPFHDVQRCVALAQSGRIDALLVDSLIGDDALDVLLTCDIPLVLVNRDAGSRAVNWVRADEESGVFQATAHLLSLGHQRITFMTAYVPDHPILAQRERGYQRAMAYADLPMRIVQADWTFEAAYACCQQTLDHDQANRPTAFFVVTELMAAGCLRAIQDRGLSVPEDISLVTVGNSIWSKYVQPQLTTVQVPLYDVGKTAIELLIQLIDETRESYSQLVLPTSLVIRDSSGPLNLRAPTK